jgi:hypothetical protein
MSQLSNQTKIIQGAFDHARCGKDVIINMLSFIPETYLCSLFRVCKEWRKIIHQLLNRRVELLKYDPFKYQKLFYDDSVLTLTRLYELGHLNHEEYISEEYMDPVAIRFMAKMMRLIIRYNKVTLNQLERYVIYLAKCIYSLRGQKEEITYLRRFSEPVMKRYLWLLRWKLHPEDEIKFKSQRLGRKTTELFSTFAADLSKEFMKGKEPDYWAITPIQIKRIITILGKEDWEKVPKIGQLKREKVGKITEEDIIGREITGDVLRFRYYIIRCINLDFSSVKEATYDALTEVERLVTEWVYLISNESCNNLDAEMIEVMLEVLSKKIIGYFVAILRVIHALHTLYERRQAFDLFYNFVSKSFAFMRENNKSLPGMNLSDGLLNFKFKALERICINYSWDELADFDPGNYEKLCSLLGIVIPSRQISQSS